MMTKKDRNIIKCRITSKTQKIIESVINKTDIETKQHFSKISIRNNTSHIQEKIVGQKSINDFIEYLEEDIDWVEQEPKNSNISCKLDTTQQLNKSISTELDEYQLDMLNSCSRSSRLTRSDIVRMCLINELHKRRDVLFKANQMKVAERWSVINKKLRNNKLKSIDRLYYIFEDDFVKHKINKEFQEQNMCFIISHYNRFKETKGHDVLKDSQRGKEILNTINTIIQYDKKS